MLTAVKISTSPYNIDTNDVFIGDLLWGNANAIMPTIYLKV